MPAVPSLSARTRSKSTQTVYGKEGYYFGELGVVLLLAADELFGFFGGVFDFLIGFFLLALKHGHSVPKQLNILLNPK